MKKIKQYKKYDIYGALFLDIDGVICTARAGYMTNPHNVWRNFDPVAIGMIRNLCDEFFLKLVASSTWRIGGGEIIDLRTVLSTHGLPEHYFFSGNKWKTERLKDRAEEIDTWLNKHNHIKRYIILDDDNSFKNTPLEKRFIQTHPEDGMTTLNYRNAVSKLKGM